MTVISEKEKVFCKHCLRLYFTGADQCNIPACGIQNGKILKEDYSQATGKKAKIIHSKIDEAGQEFISKHCSSANFANQHKIFGHPTELNKNNDCYFYLPLSRFLRLFTPIVRFFHD